MSNDGTKNDKLGMPDIDADLPAAAAALSAEDRAGLVNALKDKLQLLAGHHVDILDTLSPKVKERVEVLRGLPSQHDELEAKFLEERASLEAKYQKLYEPLYTKRYEIVNGMVEVEGITNEAVTDKEDKATEEKGVPDFWLTAMKSNEILAEEITERDEGALKYLKDIKWCRLDNPKGFKLEFYFCSNPYFKNSVLTKTYHMIDDDDPILEKAIGTEIEWYPGKNFTQKILKKKPKKGSKNAKPITKIEKCESFFNFFNPPQVPEEPPQVPEDDDDDIDDDAVEELQSLMEQDYDMGSTIRDKIIPHAVSWFTGEAVQSEFEDIEADENDDDDDDKNEDDDDDDEEQEDDDEEEEEEQEGKNQKKRSGRAQPGKGQQAERPPECKQQ